MRRQPIPLRMAADRAQGFLASWAEAEGENRWH